MQQTVYKGKATGKSIVLVLLNEGDESTDEELAVVAGISAFTVASYRQEWASSRIPKIKAVVEADLPMLTLHGWVWCVPKTRIRSCKDCPMLYLCREAVWHGNFIACEFPLEKEIIDGREHLSKKGKGRRRL